MQWTGNILMYSQPLGNRCFFTWSKEKNRVLYHHHEVSGKITQNYPLFIHTPSISGDCYMRYDNYGQKILGCQFRTVGWEKMLIPNYIWIWIILLLIAIAFIIQWGANYWTLTFLILVITLAIIHSKALQD